MSIYVSNLSDFFSEEDLNQVFAEYGTVNSVKLPIDRETGHLRGYAHVEMSTEAEEAAAIEALDGSYLRGCELKVQKKEEGSSGGGRSNYKRPSRGH